MKFSDDREEPSPKLLVGFPSPEDDNKNTQRSLSSLHNLVQLSEQPLEESLVNFPINTQHRDDAPFETDEEAGQKSSNRDSNLS